MMMMMMMMMMLSLIHMYRVEILRKYSAMFFLLSELAELIV